VKCQKKLTEKGAMMTAEQRHAEEEKLRDYDQKIAADSAIIEEDKAEKRNTKVTRHIQAAQGEIAVAQAFAAVAAPVQDVANGNQARANEIIPVGKYTIDHLDHDSCLSRSDVTLLLFLFLISFCAFASSCRP
jgi:hypothetical protein